MAIFVILGNFEYLQELVKLNDPRIISINHYIRNICTFHQFFHFLRILTKPKHNQWFLKILRTNVLIMFGVQCIKVLSQFSQQLIT